MDRYEYKGRKFVVRWDQRDDRDRRDDRGDHDLRDHIRDRREDHGGKKGTYIFIFILLQLVHSVALY